MRRRRSLSTAMLFTGLVWVILALPWMSIGPAFADPSWDLWDWQQQLRYLRNEIDRVRAHAPPDLNYNTRPYIRALEELDAWRKKAFEAAQEVQASKDPKIKAMFDDFMDTVDNATGDGNMKLELTEHTLFKRYASADKKDAEEGLCVSLKEDWVAKTEQYGNELYTAAKQLHFDHNIIRSKCQDLLERAIECVEKGDKALPSDLWPQGCVSHAIDRNLKFLDRIREQSQFFELAAEKQKADELMNRYLKEALCYRKECRGHPPPGYPHEVEKNGGREPAPGAFVRVFSPKDKQEWPTNADPKGKYRIKGVILHKDCSPFQISAEYQGDRVDTSYTGPLSEPDSSHKYEKDLLIKKKARPDTAILKGKHYYHSSSSNQTSTREIEATVRLKLKAFSADLCEVVSSEVISFKGIEEGFSDGEKRVDYKLVSASVWVPPSLGKASIGGITLQRDEKTKKVIAAQLPIIMLDLEWSGCCDTTPTKKLTIGPVTKEDKEEKKRKRNEMRKMRKESRRDLSKLMSVLWGSFHVDFKVKTGDGINRFGGSGEDVKKGKNSISKRNFEWEIYLKKK